MDTCPPRGPFRYAARYESFITNNFKKVYDYDGMWVHGKALVNKLDKMFIKEKWVDIQENVMDCLSPFLKRGVPIILTNMNNFMTKLMAYSDSQPIEVLQVCWVDR